MDKVIAIAALMLLSTVSFAQPVRTTITDDGANVTVQTPVNIKVIPICDFHWVFTDGNLQMWIEGRNELYLSDHRHFNLGRNNGCSPPASYRLTLSVRRLAIIT